MWNSLELECPVGDLVAYHPPDHFILESLRDFVTVLTTSADTLTSDSPLWNEIKVLDNIQKKYKRILRCDRLLIYLRRVGHCLRKMVLLNLSKTYLDLAERFLLGFQDISGTSLLPSRQQVEFVLIRTLSASRLVSEAISYSRECFCYLIQKIKVGHLILDLIMAISVTARLNILLRDILGQLSSIYKQVLFWRYKVKKGEFQWAEKFDFPQNVEDWINNSNPAYLKPLTMSTADINRIKLMLNHRKEVDKIIDVSDTEDTVLVAGESHKETAETDFGDVITVMNGGPSQKSTQIKKAKPIDELLKMKKPKNFQNLTRLGLPQDVEDLGESSDSADKPGGLFKPLSMSKADIDKIKHTKKVNNNNKVSDTEDIILVDEVVGDSFSKTAQTDFGDVITEISGGPNQKSTRMTKAKLAKLLKKREAENCINLPKLQNCLLQKILKVKSLKELEILWLHAIDSSYEAFPGILNKRKKENIHKLLDDIKHSTSSRKYNKSYETKPEFLKLAIRRICNKLGFTEDHIKMCNQKPLSSDDVQMLDVSKPQKLDPKPPKTNIPTDDVEILDVTKPQKLDPKPDSSDEIQILDVSKPLVPTDSIKDLKLLYCHLSKILKCKRETEKLKSLKEIFNHRIIDIKRLRQNGNKKLAKKLIHCTSKEFLALYQ